MRKLNKKEHKQVTEHIRKMLLPMHEHFGAEHSVSKLSIIRSTKKYMIAKNYLKVEETKEEHFYPWFNSWINNKLSNNILKSESELYLCGLCSELVDHKAHFYYPICQEEIDNIKSNRKDRISSLKKSFYHKYEVELPKYLESVKSLLDENKRNIDVT